MSTLPHQVRFARLSSFSAAPSLCQALVAAGRLAPAAGTYAPHYGPLARAFIGNHPTSTLPARTLHTSRVSQVPATPSTGAAPPDVYTPKHFHDSRAQLSPSKRASEINMPVPASAPSPLTTSSNSGSAAVSLHPETSSSSKDHTGDWVLFHPVYTPEELAEVRIVDRAATRAGEHIAAFLVTALRKGFDIVTRYKHVSPEEAKAYAESIGKGELSLEELKAKGWVMDENQWMNRFLFLETVAGVPGMVGGVLRHLRSLRKMQRDGGWIHTLLEEAENERMHLMTFMKIANPSLFLRLACLGAQGVFWNLFFIAYLLSPRSAHFFVGKLEEEAVKTYTGAIEEIEKGRLPAWKTEPAPQIAIDYWRLPKDAKVLDVIYAVRADEATHRFVNHSLASLKDTDHNPFALAEPDGLIKGSKPGFDRREAHDWAERVKKQLEEKTKEVGKER